MSNFKKTVCLDFDGVVNSYVSGWKGPLALPDPIVPGAIQFMLMMLAAGWTVAIHSSRSHTIGAIPAMREWLYKEAGQTWYETPAGPGLESVKFVDEKPPAILYIDDRGFRFEGVFPTLEFMENFQPWKYQDRGFAG